MSLNYCLQLSKKKDKILKDIKDFMGDGIQIKETKAKDKLVLR